MYIVDAEGAMQRIREACPEQVNLPTKFTLYADDTTVHDHSRTAVEATVEKCEPIFAEDNLKLNISKTQFVTATKSDASWRSVKLLGSRLGSAEDIDARIIAANRAFSSVSGFVVVDECGCEFFTSDVLLPQPGAWRPLTSEFWIVKAWSHWQRPIASSGPA